MELQSVFCPQLENHRVLLGGRRRYQKGQRLPFFVYAAVRSLVLDLGWRLLTRVNYLNILLFPVNAYNRYIINKYGHDSSRIILKNLKSSQKSIEEIKARLESIKPEAPKEVNTIREEIRKKLENTGTKYN